VRGELRQWRRNAFSLGKRPVEAGEESFCLGKIAIAIVLQTKVISVLQNSM
jgi:hypothetical protein